MKIVSLQAENFKKLVAVEIRPDGNLVEITGKNGQGKTSVLDALWAALAGAGVLQREPIRKGQASARIRLDLGELIVTRSFRRKDDGELTTSIKVETAEGASYPSPQKMLDSLLGALSFDPLAFARAPAKEQFNALRRFVPGVDFDAIENANRGDSERRRDINREAKSERAAASLITVPDKVPARVDETALLDEMQKASEHNQAIERRRTGLAHQAASLDADVRRHGEVQNDIELLEKQVANLMADIAELRETSAHLESAIETARGKLETDSQLPEPIDISVLRAELTQAKATNQLADDAERLAADKAKHTARADELDAQSEVLTDSIEKRTNDKVTAIAAATMPVPGLGFGDGYVTLNGLPFDQASDAEQLRASVAIAMADNPKLRVIRVRDGSLLDEASMKLLAEMAELQDFQVWIEVVDSSGNVGFVLEDGQIKQAAADQEAA